MSLSKYEKETIINYNEADTVASVYTFDPVLIAKLRKLAQEKPNDVKILRDPIQFTTYVMEAQVPVSWVHISPKRQGRRMSEEEKAAAVERLRKAREAKFGPL